MPAEQPDPALLAAARAYALSAWDYPTGHYSSAEHRDKHIHVDAVSTARQPWFAALWEAGIAEGRRQATEGWEREWGARNCNGAEEPLGDDEEPARKMAARLEADLVSRLVGPWEPVEQPEGSDRG